MKKPPKWDVLTTLFSLTVLIELMHRRFCNGLENFFFTKMYLCSKEIWHNMRLYSGSFQSYTNWRKVFLHLIALGILDPVSMLFTIIEQYQKFSQGADGHARHPWIDTRNPVDFCLKLQNSPVLWQMPRIPCCMTLLPVSWAIDGIKSRLPVLAFWGLCLWCADCMSDRMFQFRLFTVVHLQIQWCER